MNFREKSFECKKNNSFRVLTAFNMHFSFKRPGVLGRRKCSWKPWMVALTTTAVSLALAIIIGLLVYFLVYGKVTFYCITSEI